MGAKTLARSASRWSACWRFSRLTSKGSFLIGYGLPGSDTRLPFLQIQSPESVFVVVAGGTPSSPLCEVSIIDDPPCNAKRPRGDVGSNVPLQSTAWPDTT